MRGAGPRRRDPGPAGFADVRNHLAAPRLLAAMGTDVFAWHGYTQLFLGGRWVSVSPTFDQATCERAGVAPLEWADRFGVQDLNKACRAASALTDLITSRPDMGGYTSMQATR